jgi:hypothetical protein
MTHNACLATVRRFHASFHRPKVAEKLAAVINNARMACYVKTVSVPANTTLTVRLDIIASITLSEPTNVDRRKVNARYAQMIATAPPIIADF